MIVLVGEENKCHKQTQFGTIWKGVRTQNVYLRVDGFGQACELAASENEGRWKQCGILHMDRSVVTGLVDFPVEMGEQLAEALSKELGKKVHWGDAPQTPEGMIADEFDGEAEDSDLPDGDD